MTVICPIGIALIFNCFDLITGIIGGIKNKCIMSAKLRDGFFKKIGFIFCYFLAWLLDTQGNAIGFKVGVDILPVVILYVCSTEVVSIIENICKINPDLLPEKLKDMFHVNEV